MNQSPRLTDERLRSWLDTSQLDRERLCHAIMTLDRRFSDVRLRQPRGGADGGRDLEAMLDDGRPIWGAVGFQNSPSDSQTDRTQACNKFKADLRRAREENNSLPGFAFFTNVHLTVHDQDQLVTHAKSAGIEVCHIFDREHIRVVLDSPDGFAARFQYLQIALSEAEQAAFFARWGADLNSLISSSFQNVDKRLERIEFNQDRASPLRSVLFVMRLAEPVATDDMAQFRALMIIHAPAPRQAYTKLCVAIANDDGKSKAASIRVGTTLASAFWVDTLANMRTTGQAIRPNPLTRVASSGGFSEFFEGVPQATLGDLDENYFVFFVNNELASRIESIELLANGYRLWQAARDELRFDKPMSDVQWPWPLSADDELDAWVRIMGRNGHSLDFSDYTPQPLWHPHKHSRR